MTTAVPRLLFAVKYALMRQTRHATA